MACGVCVVSLVGQIDILDSLIMAVDVGIGVKITLDAVDLTFFGCLNLAFDGKTILEIS